MIDERQLLTALRFGNLDAPLDAANGVEILGELRPIGPRERALQMGDLLANRVEHPALLAQPREPRLWIGAGAVAEEPLEDHARVVLRRQRRVLAFPADRVRVRTGEPGIARTRGLARLDRELERCELRVPAGLLREQLIHRDAGIEPRLAR